MAEEFRTPQSANEAALQNWAGADNELRAPQSRIEKLLLAILGEDVTPDPPQSVNEELLTKILEQGGGGGSILPQVISRTIKEVTEKDLKGVINIGAYAFALCQQLEEITIPRGVVYINSNAFFSAINLLTVDIPETVISIGTQAFYYCNRLQKVTIRRSEPPIIGSDAFTINSSGKIYLYVPAESVNIYKQTSPFNNTLRFNVTAIPE